MTSCDTCVVRNRAVCAGLDPAELAAMNAIGRKRDLAEGESLIWEGDESLIVANVIAGVLKLSAGTEAGGEQIVGVAYPSDFIGRPFGTTVGYGVTALTEARVCVFARRDFDQFARAHPALEHKLLEQTLGELDRMRAWMTRLGRKSARERVASFLLELAERLAPNTCEAQHAPAPARITLPFSRQQIADLLGLTIETVSRQLARFKAERVIDLPARRDVTILNRAALVAAAG